MKGKLKVLGAGVLAVAAAGAVTVVDAPASTSGHFTAETAEHHVIVKGEETFPGNHNISFQRTVNGQPSGEPWKCTRATYHGTLSGAAATTTQAVSVTPTYEKCSTAGVEPHNMTIHHPSSCGTNILQFTSGSPGTVHLLCAITITHPNCTTTVPPQTLTGATYHTVTENNKHALTVNVNLTTTVHFEAGFCVFLGTTQTLDAIGTITLWGENTLGGRVGITHTAP
jgi:hypothetical protein